MSSTSFFNMIDLAAEKLGGKTLLCSDDFFAEKENLLKPGRGIFIADQYTDRGKWMDGWESRRRRDAGNDWCIIQLAAPGRIYGVDIDTNHFLGSHPSFASIEAFNIKDADTDDFEQLKWEEIMPKCPLVPGVQNFFEVSNINVYTHLRLHIYPDGGVARLKVYGEIIRDWNTDETEEVDLAAAANGARVVLCSDMFFGHMDNLIMPGKSENAADGWQTRRSRHPGSKDWVIVKLAAAGSIDRITVDTTHFKGNYPERCMIEGCNIDAQLITDFAKDGIEWTVILPTMQLQADHEHHFDEEVLFGGPYTYIRLTIFPDGGVSRMRLFGKPML